MSIGVASRTSLALKGILDLMVTQELRPGDRLPSVQELSRSLELSAVTVRGALQALESLGVLSIAHGRGVFVREGGPVLHSLFEARRVIECYHARTAASARTDRDLAALERILAVLEKDLARQDGGAYTRHDVEFHYQIGLVANNRVLLKTLQSIREVVHLQLSDINQDRRALEVSRRRHRQIVEAIRAGDGKAAERAMSGHVDEVIGKYRASVGMAMEEATAKGVAVRGRRKTAL